MAVFPALPLCLNRNPDVNNNFLFHHCYAGNSSRSNNRILFQAQMTLKSIGVKRRARTGNPRPPLSSHTLCLPPLLPQRVSPSASFPFVLFHKLISAEMAARLLVSTKHMMVPSREAEPWGSENSKQIFGKRSCCSWRAIRVRDVSNPLWRAPTLSLSLSQVLALQTHLPQVQ